MEFETTFIERVIHFALFVSAGVAVAVVALAVLERAASGRSAQGGEHDRSPRTIRGVHVAAAVGAALGFGVVERLYHLL